MGSIVRSFMLMMLWSITVSSSAITMADAKEHVNQQTQFIEIQRRAGQRVGKQVSETVGYKGRITRVRGNKVMILFTHDSAGNELDKPKIVPRFPSQLAFSEVISLADSKTSPMWMLGSHRFPDDDDRRRVRRRLAKAEREA